MNKLLEFISLKIISPIKFDRISFLLRGKYYNLTTEDRDKCKDLMESGNYLWLSRRKTHLTTYLISFGDWLLEVLKWFKDKSGKRFPKPNFKKYTHAFLNRDDDILIEAISKGVVESYFDGVFDCDWACALKINGMSDQEWKEFSKKIVDEAVGDLGKEYDVAFNIKDPSKVSCIELIRDVAKKALDDEYHKYMSDFERLISKYGNLTPQMMRDSSSFQVVLEIKR